MKPTTTHTDIQRGAAAQDIAWLLRLSEGEREFLAANRDLPFDGSDFVGAFAVNPEFYMGEAKATEPGGLAGTRATVTLLDSPEPGRSVRNAFPCIIPTSIHAELKMLWIDAEGSWEPDDAITMLKGRVTQWHEEPGVIILELTDNVSAEGDRPATRVMPRGEISGPRSPLAGERLPIVFGTHSALRLRELEPGARTRLRQPLLPGETIVHVIASEGMSASGALQVGDEKIEYDVLDLESGVAGSEAQPVRRTRELVRHSAGEAVRSVPEGGFRWLVADHPCAQVTKVFGDGMEVDPADWTNGSDPESPAGAEVVTMPVWPTMTTYRETTIAESIRKLAGNDIMVPSAVNSASAPWNAADGNPTGSYAEVAQGSETLSLEILKRAGELGSAPGAWVGAQVRLRHSASKRWKDTSTVTLRVVTTLGTAEMEISRPEDDTTAKAVGESILDVSAALPADEGWDALAILPQCRIEVIYAPDADDAVIRVHDVDLYVEHFPRTGAEMVREMTAEVGGWPLAGGGAAENPADIMEVLLTNPRFIALAGEDVDEAGLAALRQIGEAKGMNLARVVDDDTSLARLLGDAALECSTRIRAGGEKVTFAAEEAFPFPAAETDHINENVLLSGRPVTLTPDPALTGVPGGLILTAAGNDTGTGRGTWKHQREDSTGPGGRIVSSKLNWLAGGEGALARLGNILWERIREPSVIARVRLPPGGALLEPGDIITLTHEGSDLDAAPQRVEEVRVNSDMSVDVRLSGAKAGVVVWEDDDLTMLRASGYECRLTLYMSGVPVFMLDANGDLRIAGSLAEESDFAAEAQSSGIAADGAHVLFSTGTAGAFVPFMRVDGNGNAELKGTLRESDPPSAPVGGEALNVTSDEFGLSPEGDATALEFTSTDGVLRLAGRLIEQFSI